MQQSSNVLDAHRSAALGDLDPQLILIGRNRYRDGFTSIAVICVADSIRHGFSNAQLNLVGLDFTEANVHTDCVDSHRNESYFAQIAVYNEVNTAHKWLRRLQGGGRSFLRARKHAEYLIHASQFKHAGNAVSNPAKHQFAVIADHLQACDQRSEAARVDKSDLT